MDYEVKRKAIKTNKRRFDIGDTISMDDLKDVPERIVKSMIRMGWIEGVKVAEARKPGRPKKIEEGD